MKKIVVLVSGGGTNLQALIDAERAGEIKGGKISCVISSNENAYALQRAKKAGIETLVIKKADYKNISEYSYAVRDALLAAGADLVIYAGFMTILGSEVVQAFPNKMINIHPSLIPSFCGKGFWGLYVHEAVLASGVKVTGATVHFVTEECDGGPIILQKAIDIQNDDTPETLQKRVMQQCEWQLLPRAASLFCEGRIEVIGNKTVIKEKP